MLNFKTNFNKTNLLRRKHRFFIEFYENKEKEVIYFRFPTFGELYDKIEEVDFVIFLMQAKPESFIKEEMGFIAKNTYELFWGIMKLTPFYAEQIKKFFTTYFEGDFTFTPKDGMLINGVKLDSEKFNLIILMFLIATGDKDFDEWISLTSKKKEQKLDDLSADILQKMRKNEQKIKKTKESSKTKKSTDLDIIMLSIVNEIQSVCLDDIFDMNYFTFMWYYSNVNKLIENKIQIVAAGNGMLKNFNYLA